MKFVLPLMGVSILTAGAEAATPLFSFETDAEMAAFRWASKGQSDAQRDTAFATAGKSSLKFTTPAWKKGMPEWPAFELRVPVADWRPFDRLMVDVTNPNEERYTFSVFISDSKVPIRKGLYYRFLLPSRGFKRFMIPLSSFPKQVNRGDVTTLHFFAQRPGTDLVLYLDNIALLKKSETPAEPAAPFMRQLVGLVDQSVAAAERCLSQQRQRAEQLGGEAEAREDVRSGFKRLEDRRHAIQVELDSPDLTPGRLVDLKNELDLLPSKAQRIVSIVHFRRECSGLGLPSGRMLIGQVSSMEKVLPRDAGFDIRPVREVQVSLARNEKESIQIAVLSASGPLKQVRVNVDDLHSAGQVVFDRKNVHCDVVGYVETKQRPPYDVSHIGWWPDPILDFLGPVDVAEGDVQTFWIRVCAPKDQSPGVYRGTLTISAEGVDPIQVPLSVRVYGFSLPDHSPLPTAITFREHPEQMGGADNWPKRRFEYADFLADYYIDYDSLYRSGPPDFDVVKREHDQGRLVAFNLGNVFNGGAPDKGFEKAMDATVARLRVAYDRAKALGLLDHAYIYGFDERGKDQFPLLERCAQGLKKAFPEVLLMTTSYDQSFGLGSVVKTMDAWCPLTPRLVPVQAAKARAAGRSVWWYICCGPHHPYANMFVEYPAIEGRLLMGAMTAKYRPDGFLYYMLTIWNKNKPIETGPFTTWDPVSWTTYHGDGSWFCCGPGGKPVPTIRLENFRDGLEDFAYTVILQEIIRRRESQPASLNEQQRQWLAEAREALPVPETLVKTMSDYSHDPAQLYAWRNRIGDLIDRSGVRDADPWRTDFGARGFETGEAVSHPSQ